MDNRELDCAIRTDDDQQTPSYEKYSSDEISSELSELILLKKDYDDQLTSTINEVLRSQLAIDERKNSTPLTLKSTNPVDTSEHVTITRVKYSDSSHAKPQVAQPTTSFTSSERNNYNIHISRVKNLKHRAAQKDVKNKETKHIISVKDKTVTNPTSVTKNVTKEHSPNKVIVVKPAFTRLLSSNTVTKQINSNPYKASVKRVSLRPKNKS